MRRVVVTVLYGVAGIAAIATFACVASEGDETAEARAESGQPQQMCLLISIPVGAASLVTAVVVDRRGRPPRTF
jgi:hypothetical protein